MRKTQALEIVGIGEVEIYPIKKSAIEFPKVNKDGIEVQRKTEGFSRGTSYYVDSTGNKFDESEVFYKLGDKKVQSVKRTEKVAKFDVIDKALLMGDFMSEDYAVLKCSDTTKENFDRVAKNSAIQFRIKSSSIGMKFDTAIIVKFKGHLIMYRGGGFVSEGIKEFDNMMMLDK